MPRSPFTTNIQIFPETALAIKRAGKYGESYDDILRRIFKVRRRTKWEVRPQGKKKGV